MTGDRSDTKDYHDINILEIGFSLRKTSITDVQFPVNTRHLSVPIFNLSSLKVFLRSFSNELFIFLSGIKI